ncbi:hypothetical protein [Caulobacter hibisci]|uniref:Uncharacterized protein n=1 Tax=Caulobacter hibisci TaxID=2035993 RepID=A0ABS0SRS6_9CAUL|nr:hypothetical protein [Caulobacter hibisci]MBI1682325.1 hypothetical protein [Caulobacter hibisci]
MSSSDLRFPAAGRKSVSNRKAPAMALSEQEIAGIIQKHVRQNTWQQVLPNGQKIGPVHMGLGLVGVEGAASEILAAVRAEGFLAKSANNLVGGQIAENAKCSSPVVKESLIADQSVSPADQLAAEAGHG